MKRAMILLLILPALVLYGCSSTGAARDVQNTAIPRESAASDTKVPENMSQDNSTVDTNIGENSSKDVPESTQNTEPEDNKAVETKAPESKPQDGPKSIVSNSYKFESMTPENAPAKISGIYESNKEQYKVVIADEGDYTYIIAMMGEKRTGGYNIDVVSIEDNEEGKLKVTAQLTEPPKDAMVIQAITYPVDIVRIRKTNLPIYVVDNAGNCIRVEDQR